MKLAWHMLILMVLVLSCGSATPPTQGQPKEGVLSKAAIREVMYENDGFMKTCYEKYVLTEDSTRAGRVAIQFVIGPEGTIQEAKIASSTLGHETGEQCMVQVIKRLKFLKPKDGGIVIVTYPFIFSIAEKKTEQ